MKKLNKIVTVISKVAEVCLWIGTAAMLVLFAASFIVPDRLAQLINAGELTVVGFNLEIVDASGNVLHWAVSLLAAAGVLILPLGAMICRNINLIFKTTAGATFFSKGETPFQPDNVRMVREIGIFSIAIPVVELIVSICAQLFTHNSEASVNISGVFFGLVILCLSQYFSYGVSLQEEVDGLL